VTVSLDGDEATNDEVRGIKGGFKRQVETFNALRGIQGIKVVFGMTLSSYNVGQFARTFEACERECPGLTIDDVHLNVAQMSGHYYANDASSGIMANPQQVAAEIAEYRRLHGWPRSAGEWLERVYLSKLDQFLTTGRTPMPCHALRASCFVDPWGIVYPCITYSRPIGRLRETGMRLGPIWEAYETRRIQQEIWSGDCPQCWTACEAYQSILGNALALRWHSPPRRNPAAEPPSSATEVVR
jgi:radical SAM protein with 4Fe4S-binding SPASM domain